MTNAEIWKEIAGYEGMYEVSSHGKVRSYHGNHQPKRETPRILAQGNLRGYRVVNLPRLDREGRYTPLVHRLVAEAFLGAPPAVHRPTVNHKNLKKDDNRVENLEWCSHAENNRHAAPHLPRLRGEQVYWSNKLAVDQVRQMRKHYAVGGITYEQLGRIYGVSAQTVWEIVSRRNWAHVE